MAILLSHEDSHAHSLETLDVLNRYQDFMDNVSTVADMGCAQGLDAMWWAQLAKTDGTPRNIKVNAVDIAIDPLTVLRHPSINYIQRSYADSGLSDDSQDLVWSHNSLQCSKDPLGTLLHWNQIMRTDAMLVISLPYNFYINNHRNIPKVDTTYINGSYFNWTLGNLILALAAAGFDVRDSHFRFDRVNCWIQAAVYKSTRKPNINMDWYEMCEQRLLPISIESALNRNGTFKDTDIVCEWIDRSQHILAV